MLYNMFIWFLDQENIGFDPKIMILHEVISELLEISDFEAAILKNGWNCESQFFSGNIANMIPEGPLNKMVPLMEDHGGVCSGTPLAHGLIDEWINHFLGMVFYVSLLGV